MPFAAIGSVERVLPGQGGISGAGAHHRVPV